MTDSEQGSVVQSSTTLITYGELREDIEGKPSIICKVDESNEFLKEMSEPFTYFSL